MKGLLGDQFSVLRNIYAIQPGLELCILLLFPSDDLNPIAWHPAMSLVKQTSRFPDIRTLPTEQQTYCLLIHLIDIYCSYEKSNSITVTTNQIRI